MRRLVWFVSFTLLAVAGIMPLRSQSALPTKLVQQGDLSYLGSFTLPDVQDTAGRNGFEYAQGVIAFNPANQSLFIVGHDYGQQVAEVTIPALGQRATVIQGFRDPLEGRINQINPSDPNSKKIGGMTVIGDRLVLTAYSYYDGNGSASSSHFVRSTNLSSGGVQGPFRVGTTNPGLMAGYFAPIPAAWQAALGGTLLNGQCCLSIITRTSFGPSASVVSPSELVAAKNPSSATMLVGYPEGTTPLAGWESTGPLFNGTTIMRGVLLPENTATVLFFGRHGMGKYCYGEAAACNDPEDGGKGTHAYPYEPHVWAYNANDLAAVKAGSRKPWDVKPYATWRLPSQIKGAGIGGVAVDPATGRIFVTEQGGDGVKLRVHVLAIGGSSGTGDTTAPAVNMTAPTGGTVSGTVALAANASDNVGVTSVWFTVDGSAVGAEDTTAPYQASWNTTTAANGSHAIRAVARDAAGNTSTSPAVTVTVNNAASDTTAPSVSLTAPAAGATVSGRVTVSASASDNVGVASVQFTLNGVNLGSADTTAPYSLNWNTAGAANGSHVLRAVARDAAGNVTTSAARTVTVNNASTSSDRTAPTVSLTAPASGATVRGTVTVSATATDNVAVASVQFTLNGVSLGSADTTAPYSLSWNTAGAANGTHVLRAVARDAAGNVTTSAARTVIVSNVVSAPPAVSSPVVSTPTTPTPTPTLNTSCATPDPFTAMGGGTCYNGGWLPPGMVPPTTIVPPTITTPSTPTIPSTPAACTTPQPGAGWNCYNGGWLPPNMAPPAISNVVPSVVVPQTPTLQTTPGACVTPLPGTGWVCINGGWLPPDFPGL